jgi:type IV protein arginine methyltransferase
MVLYLISFLIKFLFFIDRIMVTESKDVMMAWEKPLIEAHARAVCTNGGHVLNVGFGMGLVDEAIDRV